MSLHRQFDLHPRPVRDNKSHAPLSFSDLPLILNFYINVHLYGINHCFQIHKTQPRVLPIPTPLPPNTLYGHHHITANA